MTYYLQFTAPANCRCLLELTIYNLPLTIYRLLTLFTPADHTCITPTLNLAVTGA
jgi:hypothetical protein